MRKGCRRQSVRTRALDPRAESYDRTFTSQYSSELHPAQLRRARRLLMSRSHGGTDTIAGELNSLSTATLIDFYRRWFRPQATDAHYLQVSRAATGLWGLFACAIAVWAAELGSLIEVVNRFGSYFYGSILGVFILAIGFPRATPTGAFVGLIAGMATVGGRRKLHRRASSGTT